MSARGPVDAPARGLLPVTSPGQDGDPGYPPSRGELPAPRRTKVMLTPVEHSEPEDTEVVLHQVSPASGLGTFDLGSVPASVTPPRSWRRAAWFATASSGGVVVALLFAGSALVGKPVPDQVATGWVPGLGGGGRPAIGDEQLASGSGQEAVGVGSPPATKAVGSPGSSTSVRTAVEVQRPVGDTPPRGPAPLPRPPVGVVPVAPDLPPKPPTGAAPFDADPFRVGLPQGAPATLAENSQRFFDTVTENPEEAHEMTTGDLQRQGTGALARKYAEVAYFEVEHVQVHQYDGKTVCTMRTVYKNGTRSTEQRVLTFTRGKIEDVS